MEFENQFNLSSELAKSICNIICKNENKDYVCEIVKCTIPKHTKSVFIAEDDDFYHRGNCSSKKNSGFVKKTIPTKNYTYLVVMTKENYELFSNLTFMNKEDIHNSLNNLSVVYIVYDGIFDSNILISKFPYLKDFFDYLDMWRKDTGRVTLDDLVLKKGLTKSLKRNIN